MFSQLLGRGCFCDVTLACEGQTIRAHRVVLCACSTYFENLLTNCYSEEKDPIIIMHDARYDDIKCLIEFMYKGEINVEHGALTSLLKTAEDLRIKGLAEVSWQEGYDDTEDIIASSDGNLSVSDGGSAAIIEMSSLVYNDPSEGFDRVSAVQSSAQNSAQDQTTLVVSNDDEDCISNSSSTSFSIPQNSTPRYITDRNKINSDHACSTQSSIASSDKHSNKNTRSSIRVIDESRLHNQEPRMLVPIPDIIGSFTKAETVDNAPLQSPAGFPFSKASLTNSFVKKKRGRPPLDKEYKTFQPLPKLAHIDHNVFPSFFESNIASIPVTLERPDAPRLCSRRLSEHDRIYSSEPRPRPATPTSGDESCIQRAQEAKTELTANCTIGSMRSCATDSFDERSPLNDSVMLTPLEQEKWKDVVKMSDYLAKGRRPQFWEEPFTKRVMDGINNKTLEMKKAAKILGVSYGTLYGRYRETYGCLKHPYKGQFMVTGTRMQDVWHTNGSNVSISELTNRIQQDRIVSTRAAEMLSDRPTAIMSYLDHVSTMREHLLARTPDVVNTNQVNDCYQTPAMKGENESTGK